MFSAPVNAQGLAERLAAVRAEIADAAVASGRTPEAITTIVVTKFQPITLIEELAALGVRDIAENRHQEAKEKASQLAPLGLTWHFVGQIQTKKARQVKRYANVIHSIDREALVAALDGEPGAVGDGAVDRPTDCFVQVNLTDDPARGGVAPNALEPLVERVLDAAGLRFVGLMAVAPLGEPARPAFARVREMGEKIRSIAPQATSLSMGMSQDYRDAIAEGATHLRIGTAITGNRSIPG